LKSSEWWPQNVRSSGLWRRVVRYKFIEVSEEYVASIYWAEK
jgi:hypothetical protein